MIYLYDVDTFSGMEKINGFKKGIQQNHLSISKHSILKVTKDIQGAYTAIKNLLEQKQPFSAVLTSDDILAVGAMKALREAGISVPNDCAVVGYGNSIISECTTPALTSIDSKVEATSSQAANLLADVLEEKNMPNKTIIVPELVIRETT